MNLFGFFCSILQALAAIESLWSGDRNMALVWSCYSLAGFALSLR